MSELSDRVGKPLDAIDMPGCGGFAGQDRDCELVLAWFRASNVQRGVIASPREQPLALVYEIAETFGPSQEPMPDRAVEKLYRRGTKGRRYSPTGAAVDRFKQVV